MLGGAAIRSLSVHHPCSSSSASSARSRSSTKGSASTSVDRGSAPCWRSCCSTLIGSSRSTAWPTSSTAASRPRPRVAQVQRQVSDLRKLLGPAIETRAPGYLVRTGPEALDLRRFERLAEEASSALTHGAHERAAGLLREALALWRGPPLADLAYEPFAAAPIARLEEMRLAGVEQRVEAELALGEHRRVVAELEALVDQQPTHERFRAQLITALYRSGRQEDALAAYRSLRAALVDAFGIEPTPALARLEQAVLNQDPALDAPTREVPATRSEGGVLASSRSASGLEAAAGLAAPLAGAARELLLIQVLSAESELAAATARLARLRSSLAPGARAAAFVSRAWGGDLARLATSYDVDLVVVEAPAEVLRDEPLSHELATLLERSAGRCRAVDRRTGRWRPRRPRGLRGSEHDWAAVELGAWLAASTGKPLNCWRCGERERSRPTRRGCSRPPRSRSSARRGSTPSRCWSIRARTP